MGERLTLKRTGTFLGCLSIVAYFPFASQIDSWLDLLKPLLCISCHY
jgi:hypothetical protein